MSKIIILLAIGFFVAQASRWQNVRYDRELAEIEANKPVFNSNLAFLKEGN